MEEFYVVKWEKDADILRYCEVCGARHRTAEVAAKCLQRRRPGYIVVKIVVHEDGHREEIEGGN